MNYEIIKTNKIKVFLLIAANKIFSHTVKNSARSIVIVFLLNLTLLAGIAFGQDTVTGAFQGDVSNNQTGDPISGALIQITNEQTGVVYTRTTDSKGRFYQGLLPPGFYQISISAPGLQPRLLRRQIKVSVTGDIVPVPVSLEPESAASPSAAPPQAVLEEADDIRVEINTTDARRDGSFKDEKITKIPLGATTITRTFDELALLLPGVAPPPQTVGDVAGPGVGAGVGSAGQFAVNGLRSRANNFTVDGSDNNDEDIGVRRQGFVALIPQPIESLQEYQVITLLAPAQFGRNIGAQVNAVSKQGANKTNGTVYGFLNSDLLNARNYFDTANGKAVSNLVSASGQPVLLNGRQMTVRNQSGGEDPFTFLQGGGTLGGAIIKDKLFYFLSGEYQKINAAKEKSFAVPTIEERGPYGTGASGVFRNVLTGSLGDAVPNTRDSAAIFSLFPFPNNQAGVYEDNTFTQMLPASGKGIILSARLDNNFKLGNRQQSVTGRYNFTDDKQHIPAVNEAIFSTVLSKIQTHNFSFFINSQLSGAESNRQLSNQVRFSLGQTSLNFDEVRDKEFLIPSSYGGIPFLLNAPYLLNATRPLAPGVPNTGPVQFTGDNRTVEEAIGRRITRFEYSETNPNLPANFFRNGALGQVIILGYSPLGTDVNNFPQARSNKTFQLSDELSWRLNNHTFIFGADIRRTDLNSDLPKLSRPLLTFNAVPRMILNRPGPCLILVAPELNTCRFPTPNDPNPIVSSVDMVSLDGASNYLLNFNVDRPDSKANLRYYQFNFYGQDTWRLRDNLSVSYGLRYEYNSPVHEINGLIEQTFTDPRILDLPSLLNLLDGRETLYDADLNNFAPRIGVAYSPKFLSDKWTSVFRAGYGVFYDQALGAVVNQSRNVYPSFVTINFNTGCQSCADFLPFADTNFRYTNPAGLSDPAYDPFLCFADARPCPLAVLPGTLNVLNPSARYRDNLFYGSNVRDINITLPAKNLEMPIAHHYSFTYEQQINSNLTFSIGYVGTTAKNLLRFTTPNLGTSTTTALLSYRGDLENDINLRARGLYLFPRRPLRNLGTVYLFETTASSTYNSFQTQLRGHFTNSLNFQSSYTFSKVTDDVSDVFDLAGAYVLPQNSFDLEAERAPANFDIRHRWTYQAVYDVPNLKANSFLRVLTNKLQVASTGKFHSGQPFTVNSTIDVNLDGNLTDRLATTQGLEVTGNGRQPLRLTTDNPFSLLAAFGEDGSIKRNSFRAGNVLELDLSVIKQFSINNRRLSFRTDILNFINRANFGIPVRLLEAPGFGKAIGTVTPGRRIQISLKYEF